eukprot:3975291-Pyramimonas_sp.AAC.1
MELGAPAGSTSRGLGSLSEDRLSWLQLSSVSPAGHYNSRYTASQGREGYGIPIGHDSGDL